MLKLLYYVYTKNVKISSSLKFITNQFIEYENADDMIEKISNFIKNNERLLRKWNNWNKIWTKPTSTGITPQKDNRT